MSKKLLNWMLLATMMVGLSWSVTACKDDDENEPQQEQEIDGDPYLKTGDAACALFRLVNQLADADSLPDNWRDATFEPTEGTVLDASQPYVRSVAVMNLTEARNLFR